MKYLFLFLSMCFCIAISAQDDYDKIEGSSAVEVYKSVDGVDMRLWFFNPRDINQGDPKPAIIFYFGGGWSGGTPNQFKKHSEYLAARGMVAVLADYRVSKRHNVKAEQCVTDAKSSIRYLRKNAKRLGIDPNKIISAGGSAGGHLGACVAILPGLDDAADDKSISCKPNASVLFNPVLATDIIPGVFELVDKFSKTLKSRMEGPLKSMSPYHHVKFGVGPMLIFHGTEDETVPYDSAKAFHDKMRSVGNVCTLVAYEGEGHGFFNFGKKANGPYIDTVKRMDDFLVMLGYLEAVPKLKVF